MDNEVKIQFKNHIENIQELEKYKESLATIYGYLSGEFKNKIKKAETDTKNIDNQAKEAEKSTKKMKNQIDSAFNTAKLAAYERKIKGITKTIGSYINKSATYLENMNLLDVAYNNNTESAQKFVNKLSEMYGLDESWGYRTVGIFKQLANAMGLTAEMGDKVSRTLTQFAIDTSSLYNIDTNDAVSILTSALAGFIVWLALNLLNCWDTLNKWAISSKA